MLIAGRKVSGGGRTTREVFNPATGQCVGLIPLATIEDIHEAARAAEDGFKTWRSMSALNRANILNSVARRLREESARIARQLTLEQGKTLKEAAGEVSGAADLFDWLAEEGKRIYGRVVPPRMAGTELTVLYEPVGVVAALSPWNYPLALAARKVSHALAAGCSVVLKPAEEAPSAVLSMAQICLDCGVPPNALHVLFGVPSQVSSELIAAPQVKKISFTGSVPVGKLLAAQAGPLLKKMTMELGGHSPVVVMNDALIDRVVDEAIAGKFRNAGQICISPTRFLVQDGVYDQVVSKFAERAARIRVGDGLDPATDMGPLAHGRRVEAMMELVEDARQRGARLFGNAQQQGQGYFWKPTVLADVPVDAKIMQDEPFGPVAPFVRFSTLDDAIAQANSLHYGLAAYAFTSSLDNAYALKHGLAAGVVGINTFGVTAPELPFQGIKDSGVGTAMGSEGLMDHMNIKSVVQRSM